MQNTSAPKLKKRKAILDDGCNPELVFGSIFCGGLEIPLIKKPKHFIIPSGITPFSHIDEMPSKDEAIGFFEKDDKFSDVLISPEKYIETFRKCKVFITPDCSLYTNAPLAVQVINLYRDRAIGSFYQKKGAYVVPRIRWGNRLTFTTEYFPEKIAFLGVEKHSIVAIGTYGCIQSLEEKLIFKAGLEAMLLELEPEIVLVYGAMPPRVFNDYLHLTRFIPFQDWTSRKLGGK